MQTTLKTMPSKQLHRIAIRLQWIYMTEENCISTAEFNQIENYRSQIANILHDKQKTKFVGEPNTWY